MASSKQTTKSFITGGVIPGLGQSQLEDRVTEALRTRLGASNGHYTIEEIEAVSRLKRTLFPPDFQLDQETSECFRTLVQFADVQLKPAQMIRSHRRFIGPLIVFIKKLTWPLIQIHLKDTINSAREFNARTVILLAKQQVEIRRNLTR